MSSFHSRAADVAATVSAETAAGRERWLERLERLVRIDSGRDAPEGREEVAGLLAAWCREAGCEAELVQGRAGSTATARLVSGTGPRVVLLGHHDTVYPAGTAAQVGFALRGTRALGPGVADMKGGLLLALAALESLAHQGAFAGTVELISVPDEETRPHGAFDELERVRGAAASLVLECARQNGDLVVARKAQATFSVVARGRSAHAGTHPELGRSALLALCREALRWDELNEGRPGLTVTVGTFNAGTHFASVPDHARAEGDVRGWEDEHVSWALERIGSAPTADGVSFELSGLSRWPAMAPHPSALRLLAAAEELGRQLGTPVGRRHSGGSSDGCWTAAAGVPTLDGLGPIGGHDHSPDEYIDLESWPARCGLLAGLVTAASEACEGGDR